MKVTDMQKPTAQIERAESTLQPPLDRDFRLGPWRVYPRLNRLGGLTAAEDRLLEPRLMHLLCFLAANRQEVISRDALTRELWPAVIVNENSLTRAVSELRKQLHSTALSGADFVQTISKRGYRLAPGVEFSAALPLIPTELPASRTRIFRPWAIAASLALATSLSLFTFPLQAPVISQQSLPTGFYDRVIDSPASSTAGTFTLSGAELGHSGTFRLADLQANSEKAVLSMDGKTLAFVHHDDRGSTIFLDNLELAQAPVAIYSSSHTVYNLSWSPVGYALLFASRPSGPTTALLGERSSGASLMMLNLETLEVKVLLDNSGKPPSLQTADSIKLT